MTKKFKTQNTPHLIRVPRIWLLIDAHTSNSRKSNSLRQITFPRTTDYFLWHRYITTTCNWESRNSKWRPLSRRTSYSIQAKGSIIYPIRNGYVWIRKFAYSYWVTAVTAAYETLYKSRITVPISHLSSIRRKQLREGRLTLYIPN